MKKLVVLILFFLVSVGVLFGCGRVSADTYLRIHIRANSNTITDQNIKYQVKDVVVEYMTPLIENCESKKEVIVVLNSNMNEMKMIINKFLLENGFDYGCNIKINNEFFPTRKYDDLTLKADYYDALIIELGSGEGDNWWCVVYPSLCFKSTNVVYKSKIKEIIERLKG